MIRFSRKDFPVPALPVKKTLRPLITACRTAFCSLFSVTGRAKILEGLVPCTDFCRLAARAADDALRLAGWFSCPSPGAHLRLVPPANTWCVRQKASGYLHQLMYGLWRREVWTVQPLLQQHLVCEIKGFQLSTPGMDFGGERLGTVPKAARKFLRWGGVHTGFSGYIDAILNWTQRILGRTYKVNKI